MTENRAELVHVRTPTYKRPDALRRCLESLRAQTWQNWVCDVFDDDAAGAGQGICEALADPRIRYRRNTPQRFASRNIDQCFSRANPHDADYFFVLEDDNYVLPGFIEHNIAACRKHKVDVLLRNQLVEFGSGTPQAALSKFGILDRMFVERVYKPDIFRLSLIAGIGVSNGGLFWSRHARSALEVSYACTATLQEYMRTFSIDEPILVAMKPLAVWAENGEQTTRDLGGRASWLRRELDLKRSIQILQREAWRLAGDDGRRDFLNTDLFAYDREDRARGLVKALITTRVGDLLSPREKMELLARGMLIRAAGHAQEELEAFVRSREMPGERIAA